MRVCMRNGPFAHAYAHLCMHVYAHICSCFGSRSASALLHIIMEKVLFFTVLSLVQTRYKERRKRAMISLQRIQTLDKHWLLRLVFCVFRRTVRAFDFSRPPHVAVFHVSHPFVPMAGFDDDMEIDLIENWPEFVDASPTITLGSTRSATTP